MRWRSELPRVLRSKTAASSAECSVEKLACSFFKQMEEALADISPPSFLVTPNLPCLQRKHSWVTKILSHAYSMKVSAISPPNLRKTTKVLYTIFMQPNEPQPAAQVPAQPQQMPAPAPVEQPVFQQPVAPPIDSQDEPTDNPIQWQAPEYIAQPKSAGWFVIFAVVVLGLMGVAAFLIRSWSFAVLVPVMAAALVMYINRPPRELSYVLSAKGLYINEVLHPLTEFRSFGVMPADSVPSLMLIPVKRFRPGLTVHFPQEWGEAIVDLLGTRLPMQELKHDAFDIVVRKLRL